MADFELLYAIPQLPSGDIHRTADFCRESLGFEVVAKPNDDNLLIVKRGAIELHFWKTETEQAAHDLGSASSYIRVKNIKELFADFQGRGAKFRYGLVHMPWGMTEMQIDDPYGNAIRFGEPINKT